MQEMHIGIYFKQIIISYSYFLNLTLHVITIAFKHTINDKSLLFAGINIPDIRAPRIWMVFVFILQLDLSRLNHLQDVSYKKKYV